MSIKFKKWLLPVFMGALSTTALLSPSLTQAVEETGTIAATKAADQKVAEAAAVAAKTNDEAKDREVEEEKEIEKK